MRDSPRHRHVVCRARSGKMVVRRGCTYKVIQSLIFYHHASAFKLSPLVALAARVVRQLFLVAFKNNRPHEQHSRMVKSAHTRIIGSSTGK